MVRKCSVCGKSAIFGTVFKCDNCRRDFCHRHEKEQFIRSYIHGIESSGSAVCHNYPDGRAVNHETFRCYECRTGKIPKDIDGIKWFVEEYLVMFTLASMGVFAIMVFLSAFGNLFGLSPETCKNLETTCIYYVVAVIAILIIKSVIMMVFYGLKRKKSL
ncbi:MAG: hypothetical protein PHU53_04070 [Thermoplasmata archaeon]|nr:hypothetical protein [Thermoplasmata archaeon]